MALLKILKVKMYKTTSYLIFSILFIFQKTYATIDYLVVNHFTKQLYWADTDNSPGLIGWEGLGEDFYIDK